MYGYIVGIHVVSALVALGTGLLTLLAFAHGSKTHRALGKVYLLAWVGLATSGAWIGLRHEGISVFEVLMVLGSVVTLRAYLAVLRRKQIGPDWLRRHFTGMFSSIVFLTVATLNQMLPHVLASLGVNYSMWGFALLMLATFPASSWAGKRLSQRYHIRPRPQMHA